jgi:hypothetical protein
MLFSPAMWTYFGPYSSGTATIFTGNHARMHTPLVSAVLGPYGLQFAFVDAIFGCRDLIGVY